MNCQTFMVASRCGVPDRDRSFSTEQPRRGVTIILARVRKRRRRRSPLDRKSGEFVGVSVTTSWPASMSAMRVPSSRASRRSWVTKTTVFPRRLLQGQKLALQFGAGDGIERAERFVHQEKWRDRRRGRGPRRLSAAVRRKVRGDSARRAGDRVRRVAAVPGHACWMRSAGQSSICGTRPMLRATVKCGKSPTS